ncbi:hypothetical protein SAMN05216526_0108 [Ectothiorhodosinus mongolicus]|uniref:Uncharacterized protein n=1 Tax=Ectothiorhodosinus mongolicus TaxID=233100 RepID=A0A1R3VM46_9GAMM|nr:hypothetical protein [Ectothiorhodosinus mongolicus]ULX57794.1 hypothetical protein CKX93_09110 [Ectothiorhodosinus mongolicus]SIT65658.1 hypothetical protein SAMN05216526_0108 [Ectothiorhodosinus mongolicus]
MQFNIPVIAIVVAALVVIIFFTPILTVIGGVMLLILAGVIALRFMTRESQEKMEDMARPVIDFTTNTLWPLLRGEGSVEVVTPSSPPPSAPKETINPAPAAAPSAGTTSTTKASDSKPTAPAEKKPADKP